MLIFSALLDEQGWAPETLVDGKHGVLEAIQLSRQRTQGCVSLGSVDDEGVEQG